VAAVRNNQLAGLVVGAVLMVLGVSATVGPALASMDTMGGGYAIGLAGLFLLIAGSVTGYFYAVRYRALQRIMQGEGLLARWQYPPEVWRAHLEREYRRDQAAKRSLFVLVLVLMVIIGAPFVMADSESGKWVAAVLAGTALLIALVAFVIPRLALAKQRGRGGVALISTAGLYVGGRLHVWNRLASRLERVTLHADGEPRLEFEVSYSAQLGPQVVVEQVPIPAGQEAPAAEIVEALTAQGRGGRRPTHGRTPGK
jgi:uncharacterized membrane protein